MTREQRNSAGTARFPGFDTGLSLARIHSRAALLEVMDARS
jgi:hypothetical protein